MSAIRQVPLKQYLSPEARWIPKDTGKKPIKLSYYKFTRVYTPPIKERMESPYIVGPYLKPDYLPPKYITDEIKPRHDNDLNHFIYKPKEVPMDLERKVKLLLIEDVEGLGVAGQIVDAPYRYGSSRLIAMRKAEYVTDFSTSWYKFGEKTMQSASSALSPRTARLLKMTLFDLPIASQAVVKSWHISLALRLAGCLCPVDAIRADTITCFVGDNGESLVKCTIKINNHETVEAKFKRIDGAKD